MSAKVVPLPAPKADPKIVSFLEDALASAKAGTIVALAIATHEVTPDRKDTTSYRLIVGDDGNIAILGWAVERMKIRLIDEDSEADDDEPEDAS